jgi:hypothetical protein
MTDNQIQVEQNSETIEDPGLEKLVMIFLIILLLAVIFIPSEWLLKWSMWWNNIQ